MSSCRSKRLSDLFPFFLRATALASSLLCASPAAPQPLGIETGEKVLPTEVKVNGAPGGIWPIVSRDGVLYAPVEAFTTWRVQVRPDTPAVDYRGFRYYPVTAVPSINARLNEEKGTLELTVAADSFVATRLSRELSSAVARTPVIPAAFLNYDINYSRTSGPTTLSGLGALGELGLSGAWGVATQTFLAQNLIGSQPTSPVVRLETSFRRDFPDAGYTLLVGDGIFRTALLGRGAYFGGVQFGTNFSLAPHVNRQPVPLIAGQTSTPSTVQLYVNDVLRSTSTVPAGPFTLDNLPVLSGNGDVTIRVRDILGRETLITQPFFVTAELLAPDTNDWTVEAGKLRLDLGLSSFNYSDPFVAGMLRRGLSTTLTAEGRLEASSTRRAAGVAALRSIGSDWLARAGAMISQDETLGSGHRWLIGAERPGYRTALSASIEGNSANFRSLGEDRATVPPRLQFAGQASYSDDWGRVGLAVAVQRAYDRVNIATYSLNYSTTLFDNWQVNAFFTRAFGSASGYTVGTMLTVPIGRRTLSSTSFQKQNTGSEFYTAVTHTPAETTGWAWRAQATKNEQSRAEGGAYYLSPHGVFSGELSAQRNQTDMRLGATGGLLLTNGSVFATQRFDTSAALVTVEGFPGVGVGLGSTMSQKTDKDGAALVPRLGAYVKNPIRLDPNDVPISAEIDSIELDAVPPWRSVTKIDFPVRGGRAALIQVVLDDGEPAPAGSIVRIEGDDRPFYMARRGEVYVTGLKAAKARLQLRWREASCNMDMTLPAGTPDDISRVGPLRCAGVVR